MNEQTILATATRVIRHEASALNDLAQALGPEVASAAQMILNAKGRIIVTGIGKSGHISRKIAATLSSTGTPAHFVHPAEASHGDLGMVTASDVVLAISFSGEAPELSDLIAYTRRFDIPLLAISGKADSALVRQADITMLLPPVTEACGTGVVPTTSTTLTLALGDALAVALMEHREFTAENFREFHPGDKLGAKLARVGDLMHDEAPLIDATAHMADALLLMTQSGFGVVGATNPGGQLAGIVTDGDLRRHLDGLLEKRVEDVMTRAPKTITAGKLAAEAVALMNENNITSLLVTSNDDSLKVTGILRIHDCMRAGIV